MTKSQAPNKVGHWQVVTKQGEKNIKKYSKNGEEGKGSCAKSTGCRQGTASSTPTFEGNEGEG